MGELAILVERQSKKIDELTIVVNNLTKLILKNKVDDVWIDEESAANLLELQPRTLRKKVKFKKILDIQARNTNGRNWQYNRKDIELYKQKTIVK